MLKKRLIGVLTIKENLVVQSIGYKKYLPVGSPSIVAENLDRWGVDEIICLSIDRSKKNLGPDFELIESITSLSLATPLTYGGGVRNANEASNVINLGVERIVVDNIFQRERKILEKMAEIIGSQALVISLPIVLEENKYMIFDYLKKELTSINDSIKASLINSSSSEIMLIDKCKEGFKNGFQKDILDLFPIEKKKLIVFGGLDNNEMIKYVLKNPNVSAVAIGNSLNYKEHRVQKLKKDLKMECLRKNIFNEF